MALDFPTSPALNQVYTFGSYSWRWDGTSWVGAVPIVNATINNTTIGAVTPSTGAFTTITANTSAVITGGASIGQAAFQATGNQASQLIANLTSNISGAGTSFGLRVAAGTNASDYALRVQNQAGTLDYLYVRGDGSVSMSTGLNSTAIGATTPSTGAFTSVDSSGTITSTGAATQFRAKRTGQNADFRILQGVNNTVLDNNNGDELNLAIAGTYRATLSSTGLAVTGALSSTTGATFATSSGNVGIGTSSPDSKLVVGALPTSGYTAPAIAAFYSAADTEGMAWFARGGVANPYLVQIGVNQATGYGEIQAAQAGVGYKNLILNRQGGNVGIGTTSPGSKLAVSGSTSDVVAAFTRTGGASCYVTMTSGASSDYTYETSTERTGANTGIYYFGGNANTSFRWRQGGYATLMNLDTVGLSVTGALSATGRVATLVGADVSIANSRNDNLSIGTAGFFRVVSGGASAQISGMVAGTDGQRVVIMNGTGNNVAFLFEDANSTAANRIYTESGGNITLGNLGSREFIYSTTYSRWVLVGKI